MKSLLGIALFLFLVLVPSGSRSAEQAPHYVLKVRPSARGVQFECVTGCAWTKLSATCGAEPCEVVIDESGLVQPKR